MIYIRQFDELGRDDVTIAGGKGGNLGELTRAGFPVPPGFVLTTAAYDAFVAANGIAGAVVGLATLPPAAEPDAYDDAAEKIRVLFTAGEVPADLLDELRTALKTVDGEPLAVRSSATAEDLEGASFAGQQETYLNVRGAEALVGAVKDCWASLWTARAMVYRARQGIAPTAVSLAVVVQRMVESDAAGVMFTANPTNGRHNEMVVGAAWGLGESVVSGSVTTDDLVLDKQSGRLLSRETADKAVMTVYGDHGTEVRPVPAARRTLPVLDDATATRLARLGARIEAHYGSPQDIEWAIAGDEVFVVQSRPVTALPEPVGDAPTGWAVPDPKGFYVRASIVEQLPDPLSPLFADLVDGSVTRSLQALFGEVLGGNVIRDGDVALPTINGYAFYYYRMSGMWRMLRNLPKALPLLAGRGDGSGVRRWRTYSHPRYVAAVSTWQDKRPEDLAAGELIAGVQELLDAGAEYYTSVQTIIPIAASTELLFTAFYDRAVRRPGDPAAATFLLGFDSLPIRAEKSLHDLATWVRGHNALRAELVATPSTRVLELLRADEPPAGLDGVLWREWRSRFQAHLDSYGHTVYNLDFLNPVPADDPAPLFDTLRFYLRGEGADPHERQQRSAQRREAATEAVRARLDPPLRATFSRLLGWAQSAAPVREDALADVGLAWPLMRRMLLELGRRLTTAGALGGSAEVFWLRHDELRDMASAWDGGARRLDRRADVIAERKVVWRGQRLVTPPQLLPRGAWFKIFESLLPAASAEQTGDTIKGTGAGAGTVTAAARVLAGPEDFGRMQPGDVLVATITTPAWTPLFAIASAVVTDVGGPLSHSSIVAREYGIPAVLGTGAATSRIRSGQSIRVDGDTGTVTLLDAVGETAPPADQPAGPDRASSGARVAAKIATGAAASCLVAWIVRRARGVRRGWSWP